MIHASACRLCLLLLAAAITVPATAIQPPLPFGDLAQSATPSWHPLGGHVPAKTTAFAVGDVDLDGHPDVVAVSSRPHIHSAFNPYHIGVMRNDGRGMLSRPAIYRAGEEANDVALADLDGDGDLDAITTNGFADTVSIFFNRGDGTFEPHVEYPTGGEEPRCVRVGDLDGDGHLDLAVLHVTSSDVSILLNDGEGRFGLHQVLPVPNVTERGNANRNFSYPGPFMALADLDGDGDLDLAVPASLRVRICRNDGAGGFTLDDQRPRAPTATVYEVEAADLDGDGRPELIACTASFQSAFVAVWRDLGNGAYELVQSVDLLLGWPQVSFLSSLDVGDIDGDGREDVVVGQEFYGSVLVLRNDGSGALMDPELLRCQDGPWFVKLADLNGDGWLDLTAIMPRSRSHVETFLGDGAGWFHAPAVANPDHDDRFEIGGAWLHILAADMDGDGSDDLIMTGFDEDVQMRILANDGGGRFHEAAAWDWGEFLEAAGDAFAIEDFNGDGLLDIIVNDTRMPGGFDVSGRLLVYTNLGAFQFSDPQVIELDDAFGATIATGDFDGDGDPDAAVWLSEIHNGDENLPHERSILILENRDGTFVAGEQIFLESIPWTEPYGALAAADLDGDGDLDLLATTGAMVTDGRMWTLLNDGSGSFEISGSMPTPWHPQSLVMGDFDGDGDVDAALMLDHNRIGIGRWDVLFQPYLIIYHNDGRGNLDIVREHRDSNVISDNPMRTADFDGDGLMDLMVTDIAGPARIHFGDASGTFERFGQYTMQFFPSLAAPVDADGDGMPDLARVGNRPPWVWITRNLLEATCPADLDGDGATTPADFLLYLDLFAAGDPRADFTRDGTIDARDFFAFLDAFAAGC